jgi:hypothetical protein
MVIVIETNQENTWLVWWHDVEEENDRE